MCVCLVVDWNSSEVMTVAVVTVWKLGRIGVKFLQYLIFESFNGWWEDS